MSTKKFKVGDVVRIVNTEHTYNKMYPTYFNLWLNWELVVYDDFYVRKVDHNQIFHRNRKGSLKDSDMELVAPALEYAYVQI
jgi:hypothetical protein